MNQSPNQPAVQPQIGPSGSEAPDASLLIKSGANFWHLLHSGAGTAAHNMAWDDALLLETANLGTPILRFYSWSESAASFGYFQKIAEIERLTWLRPLVRRPTGGGLVPHDADWTYSLAFPPGNPWYALKAMESYERAHAWIQAAFLRLGIATELADCCRKELPGQCFIGHEKSDVLWQGRKIAGAAQRRTRHGLLIQGSVQPPPLPVVRKDWEGAMCDVARVDYGIQWRELELSANLTASVARLVSETYSLPSHNRRR